VCLGEVLVCVNVSLCGGGKFLPSDDNLVFMLAGRSACANLSPPEDLDQLNLSPPSPPSVTRGAFAARNSVVWDDEHSPSSSSSSAGTGTALSELGLPEITPTKSPAFSVASIEGALHENHDKGATVILKDRTCLFAVLDGHGASGAGVSGFCCRNLLASVAAALGKGMAVDESITKAFADTAAALKASAVDSRFSGSTAVLCVLRHTPEGRKLSTGWVGDSRALIGRSRAKGPPRENLTAVPLTTDHKPSDPKEKQRLQQIKAIVRPSRVQHPLTGTFIEVGCERVWDSSQIYGVAMSRALGDLQVHPYIIPVPDITTQLLDDKDCLLVLASDGVWDVMQNNEVLSRAVSGTPQVAATHIANEAAKRWDVQMPGRRDDVTVVLVDLTHQDMRA